MFLYPRCELFGILLDIPVVPSRHATPLVFPVASFPRAASAARRNADTHVRTHTRRLTVMVANTDEHPAAAAPHLL